MLERKKILERFNPQEEARTIKDVYFIKYKPYDKSASVASTSEGVIEFEDTSHVILYSSNLKYVGATPDYTDIEFDPYITVIYDPKTKTIYTEERYKYGMMI